MQDSSGETNFQFYCLVETTVDFLQLLWSNIRWICFFRVINTFHMRISHFTLFACAIGELCCLRHFVLFRKSRTCHDNSDNSASVIGQLARIKHRVCKVDMCALSRSHGCGLWQWLCMQKCRHGYLSSPLCHNCLQKTHNYWCTFSPWAQALTPADNVKAAIRSLIHQCLYSIWAWDHVLWQISVTFVGSGT